jgi:hypothetical protein
MHCGSAGAVSSEPCGAAVAAPVARVHTYGTIHYLGET